MCNPNQYRLLPAVFAILISAACTRVIFCQPNESMKTIPPDTTALKKIERFLGIPIHPGSHLVSIVTDRRDDQIPDEKMWASINLTAERRKDVVDFYEKELELSFENEGEGEHTCYTLRFDRGMWAYTIFIGQDTYMNRPLYSIEMAEKEEN
jgi:hypothetical protein